MTMNPSYPSSKPQIAPLVTRSISGLKCLILEVESDAPVRGATAASHLARLKLWAGSLAAHRVGGTRSLEFRLRDASSLHNHIVSLLKQLSDGIGEAISCAKGENSPDDEGDEEEDSLAGEFDDYFKDDEDDEKSELDRLLEDIGETVDCLSRLSITIQNPAPHDRFRSRAGAALIACFESLDVNHVREKFRRVDEEIATRLGKAITSRRQYFKYREEHYNRLAEGLDEKPSPSKIVEGCERTTVASSLPEHLKEKPADVQQMLPVIDETRSEISRTTYPASNLDPDQSRVPPVPKECLNGPFLCPFCHAMVEIDTRHNWKKHVFRDLRPYVCVEASCPTPDLQYTRRSEWTRHMKQEHWRVWHCTFGCQETFHTSDDFREHTRNAYQDQVSSDNLTALEELSSQPDIKVVETRCPLCVEFQAKTDKQYSSHVAGHLEQLALFALPKIDEDDDDDGVDDGSSDETDSEHDQEAEDAVSTHDPSRTIKCTCIPPCDDRAETISCHGCGALQHLTCAIRLYWSEQTCCSDRYGRHVPNKPSNGQPDDPEVEPRRSTKAQTHSDKDESSPREGSPNLDQPDVEKYHVKWEGFDYRYPGDPSSGPDREPEEEPRKDEKENEETEVVDSEGLRQPSATERILSSARAGTPPASVITTPNLEGDLERKSREIGDLKKRIAEAEARKACPGKAGQEALLSDLKGHRERDKAATKAGDEPREAETEEIHMNQTSEGVGSGGARQQHHTRPLRTYSAMGHTDPKTVLDSTTVGLREKLVALEKSRAARAQKDAERKNSAQTQAQAAPSATQAENPPHPESTHRPWSPSMDIVLNLEDETEYNDETGPRLSDPLTDVDESSDSASEAPSGVTAPLTPNTGYGGVYHQWYCSDCMFGPMEYYLNNVCANHGCGHIRCVECPVVSDNHPNSQETEDRSSGQDSGPHPDEQAANGSTDDSLEQVGNDPMNDVVSMDELMGGAAYTGTVD